MRETKKENNNVGWHFDNTYAKLPKQLLSKLYPVPVKAPKLLIFNEKLSKDLNLDFSITNKEDLEKIFSGNFLPEGSESIAQAYAGHQFGHFTILGDGRAIILGEHLTQNKKRFDIQFKGSGRTPYSRNADGRAALGPMLREYIISEAMNNLNIPTTRSLAVVSTGENVIRETSLPGAILTRVASSHIRVGTFQYASILKDIKYLTTLVDYSINRHYQSLKNEKNKPLSLLNVVIEKQIELVVNWMRVGFIHGVMNTDNMTISGETIDYGPCAFMDTYNPNTVFSSIDYQGRYAYLNQPVITKWNLTRFAETLIPLLHEKENISIEIATEVINNFEKIYKKSWLKMMCNKLGLFGNDKDDETLVNDLLNLMTYKKMDYTNTFCFLMKENFMNKKIFEDKDLTLWMDRWKNRIKKNNKPFDSSLKLMKKNNPLVIPRNFKVEESLKAASSFNLDPTYKLIEALSEPYLTSLKKLDYQNAPFTDSENYKTFCGT
jgi:serine/tyrosine/threonine adenylyltransferase